MYESQKERATYDNLADLYTIILATEHLERAYARDAVTEQEVNTIVLLSISFLLQLIIDYNRCSRWFFLFSLRHSIKLNATSSYLSFGSQKKLRWGRL